MKITIINELNKDLNMRKYLYDNSNWYRLINRDSKNFELFKKEYKEYKKVVMMNKTNDFIDNVEMISNVVKMMN